MAKPIGVRRMAMFFAVAFSRSAVNARSLPARLSCSMLMRRFW